MRLMRHLFILFLIALLPLRGWTLERMDLQPPEPVQGLQAHSLEARMPAECALHMQAALGAGTAHTPAAKHSGEHKGCQSCQLCMPLADLGSATTLVVATPVGRVPAAHSSLFISAEPARHSKPPIS